MPSRQEGFALKGRQPLKALSLRGFDMRVAMSGERENGVQEDQPVSNLDSLHILHN